ncbi:MAG: hypothetical protein KY459_09885 [Acidobacteria bacterium]|nr:hypothetical protein [Acidobacteriota bacterium]
MPFQSRLIRALLVALIAAMTFSCTTFRAWQNAQEYELAGDWDRAVESYEEALRLDPGNVKFRAALQHARLEASRQHFAKGKQLRSAGHPDMAVLELRLAVELDPTNQYAAIELAKAMASVREASTRQYQDIEEMKRRVTETSRPPILNPASNQPISLSFPRETPVKDIYRALGSAFGINIMFDQRLPDDNISIELRDVTAQEALERVMQASTHFYKVLDEQTILVIPDNANTRREYEDLVIRTFYLSNGDAEQVQNIVRTMLEARHVFALKAMNAITIRDTADRVLIAEKIIEANDKAQAEVVVQVELLQIDASKLREIGLDLSADSISAGLSNEAGTAITALPLGGFRDLTSGNWSLTVPTVTYNLMKTSGQATLLAKPQLRISEGQSATLLIGQQVPIAVTTYNAIAQQPGTGQVFAPPTSFQYRDVGIKITIEPRVHHNREITLKLSVEVSNIAEQGTGDQPTFGTRSIESTIRLKDGETNFLAGLIRRDEADSDQDIPFLSDLPLIGRLFSNSSARSQATDLVLTMTPHIIRIPDITEEDLAPMWVGTQTNLTFRGTTPRMESMTSGDPFDPPTRRQFEQQPVPGMEVAPPPAPRVPEEGPSVPPPTPPTEPYPPVPDSSELGTDRGAPVTSVTTTASASGIVAANYVPDASEPEPVEASAAATLPQQISEESEPRDSPSSSIVANRTPRVAIQPASASFGAGQEGSWLIVGLDLDGLTTSELRLQYDPSTIDITSVSFGRAFLHDPATPPLVNIESDQGIITIRSADGSPLAFAPGGEVAAVNFRAVLAGSSWLEVPALELRNQQDEIVPAVVSGAAIEVNYR